MNSQRWNMRRDMDLIIIPDMAFDFSAIGGPIPEGSFALLFLINTCYGFVTQETHHALRTSDVTFIT